MGANHDKTAPKRTSSNHDNARSNCEDSDSPSTPPITDRSRHWYVPTTHPLSTTGQCSISWAQNPALEQHQSLGNVATECHFVPRKKHVAEICKPNSLLHLRKGFSPAQGPGTTRAKNKRRVQWDVQ